MANQHKVRIGPSNYLNLSDDDYAAWKAAGNVEYGAAPEGDAEAKAADKPAENKARKAPAEKKQG